MAAAIVSHLLASLALLGGPDGPDGQGGIAEAPAVAALELTRAPELYLGELRRVDVQYARPVESWNPFLSIYDPANFRCATVWTDEQLLWIEEEYESPALRLFVRRGTNADLVLATAARHDRLELLVRVGAVHAGRGWIEVLDAWRSAEQVPEGTVLHAIRGLECMERDAWRLAVGELERALAAPLPTHAREALERVRAEAATHLPPPAEKR